MGRKRNKGKARRAANDDKARQQADERGNNQRRPTNRLGRADLAGLSMAGQLQLLRAVTKKCMHGERIGDQCCQFLNVFRTSYNDALDDAIPLELSDRLIAAEDATMPEFEEMWCDEDKIDQAISFLLYEGSQALLDNDIDHAQGMATFVRYFEEYIAVGMKQTQSLVNWPKIEETYEADVHTLVTFFKKRIPCSCLDEKLEEVKDITKVSICYNPKCPVPRGEVERSKTMCCSRCRMALYCSRECQVADWREHKSQCGMVAARRAEAELEDKLQNV